MQASMYRKQHGKVRPLIHKHLAFFSRSHPNYLMISMPFAHKKPALVRRKDMCTRFYIDNEIPELKDIMEAGYRSALTQRFLATHGKPILTHGEIRPTDIVPVIAPNVKGDRSVFPMQWGFLTRDNRRTLFNARTETAKEKPTFRDAWVKHRCIIPAAFYYEWEHFTSPSGKTMTGNKYAIQPAGCTATWLCGLYRIEDGYPVFVVLTKPPTSELSEIHDRMPLMLPEGMIDAWIQPTTNPEELLSYALSDMVIEKA